MALHKHQALFANRPVKVPAPLIGAAATWLALIGAAFVLSLIVRKLKGRFHAFGFAGVAGAICAVTYSMADPQAIMALVETYAPMSLGTGSETAGAARL